MSKQGKQDGGRPRKRQEGLVVQELPEEMLVYDTDRHKAHCLGPVAAAVWEACNGRRSAAQIAARVTAKLGQAVPVESVWLSLRRLGRAAHR